MPAPIHVPRIIHTIHATTDIYGMRMRYQDALGGLVFAENYFPAEDRDCALLYVANHMVEAMAPSSSPTAAAAASPAASMSTLVDALRVKLARRVEETDPYFQMVHTQWGEGLRRVFAQLPDPDWS